MPRFSVIVPAYKVQGYLRECLDSVLGQSFTDVEVIAVDDCSPDASGRILDEYAARDDRVRVLHLPENTGLGRARNAGVAQARGDYLLFLDSDDTFLPGALAAIARRLAGTDEPELLFFDHVRTYWWGRTVESIYGELLASAGDRTFSAVEEPQFVHLFTSAWNKAYRRDFYLRERLEFRPGLYEDVPVAYKAILSSARTACLPRPCLAYRQRRQGAITRTPGRKHFDIFDQYASVFAYLDERPDLNGLRPLLFERMISHFLFTAARADRVRPADRGEFFRRAAEFHRRYRPEGFVPPEEVSALDFRLVAIGSAPLYGARMLAERVLRGVRNRARRAKTRIGKQVYALYYRAQLRLPLDPGLAVYASYWNRGASCSPAAIERKAAELAPHVRGVWVVRPDSVDTLPPGTDHVLPGSPRYWKVMARATYLVNNVNFPNEIVKRPGSVHVMTHHGTPLKKMGLDQQQYPAAANGMSFARLLERADRWDVSVSSNQHSTEVWERVYPCGFESVEAGYPRNDVYFTAGAEDVLRVRASLGVPEGTTAILYAPTHRDYQRGFEPRLDIERFCESVGPRHVVLMRAHYFYPSDSRLQDLQERGLIVDVSDHPSTEELCLAADVLLTDYSSIMFDYAALDRPIVVYADDWETYREARGVYFDLLSGRPGDTPGAVATTEDELIEVFTSGSWDGPEAAALRAAFRERFCGLDDGHAAERIVRRVMLGEGPGLVPSVVPPAERRPAPAPRHALAGRDVSAAGGRPTTGEGAADGSRPPGSSGGPTPPSELLTPERST